MPQQIDEPATWVLAAARELNQHGSWTGRIHIHKLLFVTKVLGLAEPPFAFVLHDYGPYSFELDEEIINLEMAGRLDHSYPTPGYGPRYEPTPQGRAVASNLSAPAATAVGEVAAQLGDGSSQKLELLATCLWVQRSEGITREQQILLRVKTLKPQYAEPEVKRGLEDAQELVNSLAQ